MSPSELLSLVRYPTLAILLPLAVGCVRGDSESTTAIWRESMRPPVAKQVPYELTSHDHTRSDPYYWMRDDARRDPEVLGYLEQENAYAEAFFEPLDAFRSALYEEIVARIPKDDASVPHRLDGYYYYDRVEDGDEYRRYCRRRGSMDAPEEVFFDANREAEGHDYYSAVGLTVSVDGNTLGYGEDTLSRRIYTLRFRDLVSGRPLDDVIEGTTGQLVFALDNRTVFYVKRDPGTLRAYQVYRHHLGTNPEADELVFHEEDEEFYLSIRRSRSREYILIASRQTLSHEYLTIDAQRPDSAPVVVLPRERGHEYDLDHARGRFFIRTNWQARDFRLMSVAPEMSQDKSAWRDEVPAEEGVFLRDFELFAGHLAVSQRRRGRTELQVIPWTDREKAHQLEFDEQSYVVQFDRNSEFDSATLRFAYQSMTTPRSVFDFDMEHKTRILRKQSNIEGDFSPEHYSSASLTITARDGAEVPVSLVFRADLDRSKPQPLLLYGYGSYGYSMDPTFSSPRLSLLDRGVIFAIAHVRGGQELGRAWYEDGKLLQKRNTFTDFIDVAEGLIRAGWTETEKLFAQGGSAGGLLVGAVANMRPDLFAGIVANVPFVDVVTTMLDESIPLTTFEYDEWGNPGQREYYEYMLSYSPYDNVSEQDYPAMLVITGLHDSQVQYWEPAKWVARLRARGVGRQPIVFSVNMDAGHGGASGRYRRHRETAMAQTFILSQLNRVD
ncbi:MAG: S9 family peptidase [Myxococcota bacterium]